MRCLLFCVASYPFELMMARRQVEMQVGGPGYYHAEQGTHPPLHHAHVG
jgi:hypothetical protein